MKKLILIGGVVLAMCLTSFGQKSEVDMEAKRIRAEIVGQQRIERLSQEQIVRKDARGSVPVLSLTDAEVGESGSFNKNAKFFGTATAGVVVVSSSCDPIDIGFELGPDDRCLLVTNPAVTTIGQFNDIGRIALPGKKADNIIYLIANHTTSFVFQNLTAGAVSGLASYSPSITIESEALNDPAAIDPNTGLPMNGAFTTTGLGTKSSSKTLAPTAFDLQTESYSRANTNGLSRTFWAALGLPNNVINEIYKKPMTIRLNVTVRVRHVESGTFLFSSRLLAQ
jgi:hypothetical protein